MVRVAIYAKEKIILRPLEIHPGCYTIGRNPDADLVVSANQDSGVSSNHAVITIGQEVEANGCIGTVRDVSSQGTFINRFRISKTLNRSPLEVPLFEGDSLGLGQEGYSIRIPRKNATMTEPYSEVGKLGGSYSLRGSLIDDDVFGASEMRLLDHLYSKDGLESTYEEIYAACNVRVRSKSSTKEVKFSTESRYCQQLISHLRGIFKERERYPSFIFRNHRISYSMARPEI